MKKKVTKKTKTTKLSHKVGRIDMSDYAGLLMEIKERVRSAQYEALRAVNKELVTLYWDIGRMIVERLSDATHGDAIVERIAQDLRLEFPGLSGFSRRNMFYMREFYLAYSDSKKVQPLVAQIAWTHNLIILQRCKDPLEREFYIRMTRKFGWSKNILIHQIEMSAIGIILCKDKRRTIVEYALRNARKPIGVATYRIVKRLPKALQGQLPSPEQIAILLENA